MWPNTIIKYSLVILAILALIIIYLRPAEIRTYQQAKDVLETDIYFDHRVTLYCGAAFDADKNIVPPGAAEDLPPRSRRMEWEHAVPAENFGRLFLEWRQGHPDCVENGKPYRGRRCAQKVNPEYQRMERDMYNLFPAVGLVNARRRNRQYAELPFIEPDSGICGAKIAGGKFEPPSGAKGRVARASLYMDWRYPQYSLSPAQKKLFIAWDNAFPVDQWECLAAKRIEKYQGNENPFVKAKCRAAKIW